MREEAETVPLPYQDRGGNRAFFEGTSRPVFYGVFLSGFFPIFGGFYGDY
jgi:hypothetical protein